jgi:phage-related protein
VSERYGSATRPARSGSIYVAKFAEAIFVLHCFEKKSQRTSRLDIDLATRRYRELVKELRA